jgi:uncharacterized membrane protein YhhN
VLIATLATLVAVIALLVFERLGTARGIWVAKPAASLGFVCIAWFAGALSSTFGSIMLGALVLCAIGDVLLIPAGHGAAFQLGTGSFVLGHGLYAWAFWLQRPALVATIITAAIMLVTLAITLRWLKPHLPAALTAPVYVYTGVISVMVSLAVGASVTLADPRLALAAIGFAASDLSVARDRFVQPSYVNLLWGLPLYYAAQVVFAWNAH